MKERVAQFPSIVVLVLALAIAPAALAARGGGGGGGKPSGGTSTFTLVPMDGATEPAHYGRITFDVKTDATDVPEVGLRCYQGSNFVYDAYVGYHDHYLFDPWFTLQSNYWVDGLAATCNARLFYWDRRGREVLLKTMSFSVAP